MELVNRFIVDAPVDLTWAGLLDIPLVVDCLPGATLTETVSPTSYKGNIRVRLGPIVMEFAGVLTLVVPDPGAHSATVKASWNETKNRGSATSTSRLSATAVDAAAPARTDVQVQTDVQLAGQVAQYGRGVGIINAVAGELIKQFAANLQNALTQRQAQATAMRQAVAVAPTAHATTTTSTESSSTRNTFARQAPKEISTLALLWSLFKSRVRALFARH
jgi:carbon monoxide dehydrogenase subunit G